MATKSKKQHKEQYEAQKKAAYEEHQARQKHAAEQFKQNAARAKAAQASKPTKSNTLKKATPTKAKSVAKSAAKAVGQIATGAIAAPIGRATVVPGKIALKGTKKHVSYGAGRTPVATSGGASKSATTSTAMGKNKKLY